MPPLPNLRAARCFFLSLQRYPIRNGLYRRGPRSGARTGNPKRGGNYPDDTYSKNGAFQVISGTHQANHVQRVWECINNISYNDHPQCSGGSTFRSIEAEAGSLIVFDNSITHRRGLVASGNRRRAVFAHCYSIFGLAQLHGASFSNVDKSTLFKHFEGSHGRPLASG